MSCSGLPLVTFIMRIIRWWWRPWNWSSRSWLIAILAGVLFAPFISRWILLGQIPDVMLPFDVEDVVHEGLPPDRNAFTKYASILASLRQYPLGDYTASFWVADDKRDAAWNQRFDQ